MNKLALTKVTLASIIMLVFSSLAMASSCCPPTPNPSGLKNQRNAPVRQDYGELFISGAKLRDHNIIVTGTTDLPFGGQIMFSIQPAENLEMIWSRSIEVMKNPFAVNIPVPEIEHYAGGNFLVQAVFDPEHQSQVIQDKVGRSGENLIGSLSVTENGRKFLHATRLMDWFDISGQF